MSKGISVIIAEVLLIGIGIAMVSSFFLFYMSSSKTTMGQVENQGNANDCERMSNFMTSGISGDNITIKNTGGTSLNATRFSAYLDSVPVSIEKKDILLTQGEEVVLKLGKVPPAGSRVKVIGECNTLDEFVVR
jgi:hypothetical protein